MSIKKILIAGNELLHKKSDEVLFDEMNYIEGIMKDLRDTLIDFRRKDGSGRGIAAPQIGILKRVIYLNVPEPFLIINPLLEFIDDEKIIVWDDCFSFPGIKVRVKRYKRCLLRYKDEFWNDRLLKIENEMSELIQHEYDHLDGILALSRAIDGNSFKMTG